MSHPDNRHEIPTIDLLYPTTDVQPQTTRQQSRHLARLQAKVRKLNTKETPGPNRQERRLAKFKPGRYADLQLESDINARLTWIKRWIFVYNPRLRDALKSQPRPTPNEEVTPDAQ